MAPWAWAVVAVVALALVVAATMIVDRRRRTGLLRTRFGPEYAHVLATSGNRRAAEAALTGRVRAHAGLTLVPLPEPVRRDYTERWRGLQELFVDRPSDAVEAASGLLTRLLRERGYPPGPFEEQADLLSVDHPHVVEDYRTANATRHDARAGRASTEDLREAVLRYRSVVDALLAPEPDRTGQDRTGQDTTRQEHR